MEPPPCQEGQCCAELSAISPQPFAKKSLATIQPNLLIYIAILLYMPLLFFTHLGKTQSCEVQ